MAVLPSASARHGRTSRNTGVRLSLRRSLAAAAIVLLLSGLFTLAGLAAAKITVAAVSIDINPSIELDINILDRVIAARSFNERGTEILSQLELVNMPIRDAIGQVILAAAKSGCLAGDGSSIIAIITSTDNKALKNKLENITDDVSRQVLTEESQQAVIYHDNTALARVAEARDMGNITPGKLNLIHRLVDLDPTKEVSDYVEDEVSDIMKQIVALEKQKRAEEKETGKTTGTAAVTTASELKPSGSDKENQGQTKSKMEEALEQAQSNRSKNSQQNSNS
jgi:hypothetical protein